MIFTEMGLGNCTLVSTEVERGGRERRIRRFMVGRRVISLYVRIWIGHWVLIADTHEGLKVQRKGRNTVKVLFGIVSARR